jgi:asparagine synthase (glutamine-hydrolysing)
MCGIAGFWNPAGFSAESFAILKSMTDSIRHRGPDDEGHWQDPGSGVALGHRRLSIIDLSSAGHQPMTSECGRYVVVYNGEIYNFEEIRTSLESEGQAPAWRGHSDTEVLLAAITAWGFESALQRASGMFAIAMWDKKDRRIRLARDRMGEKPLYYGWLSGQDGPVFVFASELSAIERHPAFKAEIDPGALNLLLRHNYVPAPASIYRNIRKIMPGCHATLTGIQGEIDEKPYWDFLDLPSASRRRFSGTPEDAVEELDRLLRRAIGRQSVSDVPVGAFLSGGIDSSTVVGLMQQIGTTPVQTFTIGFSERGFDEAVHAKAVAAHLGTDHTELYVSSEDALAVVPELGRIFSEPFADSSQIPTFLVSALASKHVTVSLSGDGGDELFGGYDRYRFASRYGGAILKFPKALRRTGASAISAFPADLWNAMRPGLGRRMDKIAHVLRKETVDEVYLELISHFADPGLISPWSSPTDPFAGRNMGRVAGLDPVERMMASDSVHYLPDDILVKVDRAAMANSLETRVPLLDPEVVAFAWSLPLDYKIRDGKTKWPLRQLLYRSVPKGLVERPKMGFGVPISGWLRGPLRAWAEDLLSTARLESAGYFDCHAVRSLWASHISGREDNGYRLWTILMFQSWLFRHR